MNGNVDFTRQTIARKLLQLKDKILGLNRAKVNQVRTDRYTSGVKPFHINLKIQSRQSNLLENNILICRRLSFCSMNNLSQNTGEYTSVENESLVLGEIKIKTTF